MPDSAPVRIAVPARFGEAARRFAESGAEPVTPRVAATVVLLRSASEGFDVYALRRASTMAFAPSMYAFPGGSVDVRDSVVEVGWAGPCPEWWGGRLGLDGAAARAVVCAAVREVFEECGVLLAGPDESTVVGDVSGEDWEAARLALLGHQVGLADLLAARGLVVRSDLLVPWARWVTPVFEPRRFDTYFFLARLPAEQRTRDVGGEADHTVWASPAELAALPMLPPTAYTLRELCALDDVDTAMAAGAGRDLTTPIRQRFQSSDDGAWLIVG
jgi:8-oxo-dGTP pyrophosphatase MutT (NUDIX family)